jgi:hypothetical protein
VSEQGRTDAIVLTLFFEVFRATGALASQRLVVTRGAPLAQLIGGRLHLAYALGARLCVHLFDAQGPLLFEAGASNEAQRDHEERHGACPSGSIHSAPPLPANPNGRATIPVARSRIGERQSTFGSKFIV